MVVFYGSSCAGGVRDDQGRWLYRFTKNLDSSNSPKVELQGLLLVVTIAWNKGIAKIPVD
jgi:hypothetical protein